MDSHKLSVLTVFHCRVVGLNVHAVSIIDIGHWKLSLDVTCVAWFRLISLIRLPLAIIMKRPAAKTAPQAKAKAKGSKAQKAKAKPAPKAKGPKKKAKEPKAKSKSKQPHGRLLEDAGAQGSNYRRLLCSLIESYSCSCTASSCLRFRIWLSLSHHRLRSSVRSARTVPFAAVRLTLSLDLLFVLNVLLRWMYLTRFHAL